MSATRSRPGDPNVRKSADVGPDYPKERFRNPWNGDGIEFQVENCDSKTLRTPNGQQIEGAGLPLHEKSYNELWEGK